MFSLFLHLFVVLTMLSSVINGFHVFLFLTHIVVIGIFYSLRYGKNLHSRINQEYYWFHVSDTIFSVKRLVLRLRISSIFIEKVRLCRSVHTKTLDLGQSD